MDIIFLQDRITATKVLIVAVEDALTALATGGIQRYTIDTSQTRQDVQKADIPKLNTMLDSLYNRLCTLQTRLDGSGNGIVRPGW